MKFIHEKIMLSSPRSFRESETFKSMRDAFGRFGSNLNSNATFPHSSDSSKSKVDFDLLTSELAFQVDESAKLSESVQKQLHLMYINELQLPAAAVRDPWFPNC
mmetsp:Transcript_8553/g.15482  ORF Transcript_8553/g.15482 Transcript_8553/m.15482 type:complete len:104 (-) Transcript_8553:72-383(-)